MIFSRTKQPMLWYVGLESIESRYTLQLTQWNEDVFQKLLQPYQIVLGDDIGERKISVGQVLDAMGRPYYAMAQIQELIKHIKAGHVQPNDMFFFEDMFHPGFEALPYMFNQMGWRPKVFVRCLAQTIDPDDFVHATGMAAWMRKYEAVVNDFVDCVFIASHEMAANATAAGWTVPLYVTGLPFGIREVQERARYEIPSNRNAEFRKRPLRVLFAARTDREKQPQFFIELAKYWKKKSDVPVEFAFVMGTSLRSNDEHDLATICDEEEKGTVKVYQNLTKETYYDFLKSSRVLFNCALQDWVSNTVSEADALGCNVLYPAYRSFPEAFDSDHTRLYTPWSIHDAYLKLRRLLSIPHPNMGAVSRKQDATVAVTLNAMKKWTKGNLVGQQRLVSQDRYINPRDTTYRARCSQLDWATHEDLNEFWHTGTITDKQLLNSYKGK